MPVLLGALAGALAALLCLPVVALLLGTSPEALGRGLQSERAAQALALSLLTTALSLGAMVVTGTPLAWFVARSPRRWAGLLLGALQLPVVLPPAVAGLALLMAFGRQGLLGGGLELLGLQLSFSAAAVVLAQLFVAAPLYVQGAVAAFRRVDPDFLLVAQSLGASPIRVLFRVAIPLARGGLLSAALLAWARALGEFGATLMFAGSLPGRTQTLPLAVYGALEVDLAVAQALSVLMVAVAVAVLVALRLLGPLTFDRLGQPEALR
jgi:molybdate transport system permease protein